MLDGTDAVSSEPLQFFKPLFHRVDRQPHGAQQGLNLRRREVLRRFASQDLLDQLAAHSDDLSELTMREASDFTGFAKERVGGHQAAFPRSYSGVAGEAVNMSARSP